MILRKRFKIVNNIDKQAWANPGFSAKTWCLVLFLENLKSIFNLEKDGIVLLIQLRDALFKFVVKVFYCGKWP